MLLAKELIFQIEYHSNQELAISKFFLINKYKKKLYILKDINFRFGDWELPGEGEKETLIQKYQRLQCEIKELYEEVNDLKVFNLFVFIHL